MTTPTRQNSAILFADVAGSSRLYKSMGDDRAEAMINSIVAEMSALSEEQGGRIIKTIGDEIMAAFDSAEAAVRAAISISRHRSNSTPRMEARIGTHYGPTLVRNEDVFGEAVNDAAALVRIARGGQIVTTADTVEELPEELRARATRFDRIPLKGSREPTVIYLVYWDVERRPAGSTEVVHAIVDHRETAAEPARIELQYQDQWISIGTEDLPFIVGRDPEMATLPVRSSVASRDHFHVDYRRGKFVLKDNSTNGTWVHIEGQDKPIYLRREETPLTGGGTISIGRAISEDDPHLIRFRL